jgi:hypothetical protein
MARFIRDSATFGMPTYLRGEYKSYLQQQEYVRDLGTMMSSQMNHFNREIQIATGKISGEIAKHSANQISAIQESTRTIVGSLDKGFGKLSKQLEKGFYEVNANLSAINCQLSELNMKMDHLSGLIDMKLSALIEQQRITNYNLEQIIVLAKIPEFQKERIYYLENGLKYLKNAQTNPRRYSDALDCLKEAEKREKRDYLTLFNIGVIYLFSSENMDIAAAEDYFLRSADYANDEIPEDSIRSTNYIGNVKTNELKFIKNIASNSLYYASYSQYLLDKFEESIENSNRALEINPNLKECYYNNAVTYFQLSNEKGGIESISKLSDDHNYILDASFNKNIAVSDLFQEFILDLKTNKKQVAENKLESTLKLARKDSPIFNKCIDLKENLKDDSLLSVLSVIKSL